MKTATTRHSALLPVIVVVAGSLLAGSVMLVYPFGRDQGIHAHIADVMLSGGTHSMIIDPVHFMPGKLFKIHGVPEHAFIALGKPVERSEGWIRVTIEAVDN